MANEQSRGAKGGEGGRRGDAGKAEGGESARGLAQSKTWRRFGRFMKNGNLQHLDANRGHQAGCVWSAAVTRQKRPQASHAGIMRCSSAFLLGFALFLAGSTLFAQLPESAPFNPAFVEYSARAQAGQDQAAAGVEHGYGWRPSPVDLSHLKGQRALFGPLGFTPSYDLRSLGRVTSVKNQGAYGTCWAYSTFGSLESCRLPSENRDFSENNLVNLHGFDLGFDSGGDAFMSMAYLARWGGPMNESDDPYPNPGKSPSGLTVQKHVQQVRLFPVKTTPTGNDEIKQALVDYGAIHVSYYHDDAYYNSTYKTYRYTGTNAGNHAVTLVGWDDNFDKNKFTSVPADNGAYIVKNSWGTGWGENGYYYVSYYDGRFAYEEIVAFLNAEPTASYARLYSYDPLGWVTDLGAGTTTFWGANIFTAAATENLGAVAFYANSVNTSYEIYIYTGVSANAPRSGTLRATKTGTSSYPGFRTVSLDTPAALTAGQQFSIVLKLTTPGYNYPQPAECAVSGYSSGATAAAGQSYYSSSGSTWDDLTTFNTSANFCIKGYTLNPPPSVTLSLAGSPMAEAGGVATVTATLSAASGLPVTVNLAFSGTATPTEDYTRSGTSITIPAGSLSGSITLTAVQDALSETDETIVVDIDTVVNGTENAAQQVSATILDAAHHALQVTGQVELQSFLGTGTVPLHTRTVTFVATAAGSTTPLQTWVLALTNVTGAVFNFALTNVPLETAAVSVKTDWNLRRKLAVTFDGSGSAVANFTDDSKLLGGDINTTHDNKINAFDNTLLKNNWGGAMPHSR
jgi:C1A family cysteine protease